MIKLAIIAALDRELAPLVRNWQSRVISDNGHSMHVYEHSDVVAVAGGIGAQAAEIAARVVINQCRPQVLVSAGVAGAAREDLTVGTIITPQIVINASTGEEYRCHFGCGTLVTLAEIADSRLKRVLAKRFQASAVDMEAAAVAAVAQQEQIRFCCVKAISDQAGFVMPPLNQFVHKQGQFRTAKFALWAALRPWHWLRILALAQNTRRASNAMCDYLKDMARDNLETLPGKLPGKTTKVLDV